MAIQHGLIDLDRLQSTLLTSGLQTKDQPAFQVITQLIKALKQSQDIIAGLSNTTNSIVNNITNIGGMNPNENAALVLIGQNDFGDFDSFSYIPGPRGLVGFTGNTGSQGITGLDGIDGERGDDGFTIIGPRGFNGFDGKIGPPGIDGELFENSFDIPFNKWSVQFVTDLLISNTSLTVRPLAGSNLNVDLSTTGDFAVNTNQLYVDTSTGFVGIGMTIPTTALQVSGGGLFTGTIGSSGVHFRPDVAIEVQGINAGISLFNNRNPGLVNSDESYIVYGAYDAAGTIAKTASISAKWRVATGGSAAGVLRLNATTISGTVDNISIRIFGDQGVDIFGISDIVGPGASILRINGIALVSGNVGIGSILTPFSTLHIRKAGGTTWASGDQIRIDSTVSGNRAEIHFTDNVTSDALISFVPSATATLRYLSIGDSSDKDLVILGNGLIGIGTNTPSGTLDIHARNSTAATIFLTADTGTKPSYLKFSNTGGQTYIGRDDSVGGAFGGDAYASGIYANGNFPLEVFTNAIERLRIGGNGSVVFNESGADADFRIEGDTEQNLFFLDASTDRIGIGIALPLQKLHVVGNGSFEGLSLANTGGAATSGQLTMVLGTKTINTTAATATCLIFFQRKTAGGTIGFATTYTVVAGTSFTVTSDSALDASVYNWWIVETH